MLVRRARIQRLVTMALRVGYLLYGLAGTIFFVGFMTTMTPAIVWSILACLIARGILLAPGLVFKYGLKAALREEQAGAR